MALMDGQMHVVYQTMCAMSVGFLAMVTAMAMSYTSPALPSMHKDPDFIITKEDGSWIGSMVPALAVLGSLVAGSMLDNLGRRASLCYLAFPLILSWGIITMSRTVTSVIFGRMLLGICVGIQGVAGPVLTAEIIQPELRNKLAFFTGLLRHLGITITYIAGSFLSWRQLAWLGCLASIPPSLLLIAVPETPFFLTRSGKKEKSLAVLQQLRKTPKEAEKEQSFLDETCRRTKQKEMNLKDLLQPPNRWPVVTGAALVLAQQTTGMSSVMFYASTIFEQSGDAINPSTSFRILGLLNPACAFIGIFCAARFHRRTMLAASTAGVVLSLSVLSIFLWAQAAGGELFQWARAFGFTPVVALIAFKCSVVLGWGPVPMIFIREGLPSAVRGQAASIIITLNWASAFVMTKSFQWCVSVFGLHYTFIAYAVITGINGSLMHRFMPETYGKSAEKMDKLFLVAAKTKKEN